MCIAPHDMGNMVMSSAAFANGNNGCKYNIIDYGVEYDD